MTTTQAIAKLFALHTNAKNYSPAIVQLRLKSRAFAAIRVQSKKNES